MSNPIRNAFLVRTSTASSSGVGTGPYPDGKQYTPCYINGDKVLAGYPDLDIVMLEVPSTGE